jgi:hypothetical protein
MANPVCPTSRRTRRPGRAVLVALAVTALVGAGCGDDAEDVGAGAPPDGSGGAGTLPDRPAEYRGELTSVTAFEPVTEDCVDPGDLDPDGSVSSDDPPICTDPATAPLGSILVEEVPSVQEGEKISLGIDQDTALLRADAGVEPEAVTFDDLSEGDQVEAWVDGPVADSYPQQGAAAAVLVTGQAP